jgi:hypothetical protein
MCLQPEGQVGAMLLQAFKVWLMPSADRMRSKIRMLTFGGHQPTSHPKEDFRFNLFFYVNIVLIKMTKLLVILIKY